MVVKFTKVLPGWLRRCGVQRVDLDDAVQEALAAALVKLRELPSDVRMDDAAARHELMRIVSNVALRARRHAQREGERYVSVAHIEMPTARDEEMWVDARMVILAAIEKLDEPARALIYAHEIEGKTYAEIAATLKVKEDAAEKRVVFAKQRLRAEIERIERGRTRTLHVKSTMPVGLGFDSFDRAVLGALHEVLFGKPIPLGLPKMQSFVRPTFPTSVLVGALALAPMTEEGLVPSDKHVSSVEVPGAATSLAVRTPSPTAAISIALAQGSTSATSTANLIVEPARAVQVPAAVEEPKVKTKDLIEEEKARRERSKVWGGVNTPRFDDP